jgi:hypothetical protein
VLRSLPGNSDAERAVNGWAQRLLTSGGQAEACRDVLLATGAGAVTILTLAVAQDPVVQYAQDMAVEPARWPMPHRAGVLVGSYATESGRRDLRAVETLDDGICLIDEGPDDALLVEPRLEQMAELRALAADYLAQAREYGEPQVRHPWPPEVRESDRS